jgi:hypothetical protein
VTFQQEIAMFNSLDEEIHKSESNGADDPKYVARYLIVLVVSAAVFSGLVLSIWFLG